MTLDELTRHNIEVKGEWKYLYHAVDCQGNTLDFMLSAKRDARAAEPLFSYQRFPGLKNP